MNRFKFLLIVAAIVAVAITASPKEGSGATDTFLQLEPTGNPAVHHE